MKRILYCSLFLILSINSLRAQQVEDNNIEDYSSNAEKVSLGLGFGQDYGGMGGSLLFYPQENLGVFGGVGYAFAGMGFNVGAKLRFLSTYNSKTNFFLMGMYGYNAAITVTNAAEYDKFFYGPSFGVGIDTGKRSYRKGYWTLALFLPLRSSKVREYMDDLTENHGVEFENDLFPITFSVGYRFSLE